MNQSVPAIYTGPNRDGLQSGQRVYVQNITQSIANTRSGIGDAESFITQDYAGNTFVIGIQDIKDAGNVKLRFLMQWRKAETT